MESKNTDKKATGIIFCEDARSLILTRKEILLKLLEQGIGIDVAVPQDEYCEELEKYGCRIIPIYIQRRGMNPFADFGLMMQFRKILKKKHYDFAITYSIKPNIYGGLMLRMVHVPYFINITGMGTAMNSTGLLRSFVCFLYRFSSPYATGVFFENASNRQSFVDWHLCRMEQTHVFPGAGINIREFTPIPYPASTKETCFLFIGRLMAEKGVEELCKVAKQCEKELPDIHFDLVGPFEDSFMETFNNYKSLKNLHAHGFQKSIRPFMEKAHAVILPSYHEGMANVLLEGGAFGRPLLTSGIPGCQEAVIDHESGFLFKSHDVDSLMSVIRTFHSLSQAQREEMGQKSREHIASHFNRDFIVEKINGLIHQILKRRD